MAKSKKEWIGATGFIIKEMLVKHLSRLQRPIYYTAGPPALVAGMREMLSAAGVHEDDVRSEDFAGY